MTHKNITQNNKHTSSMVAVLVFIVLFSATVVLSPSAFGFSLTEKEDMQITREANGLTVDFEHTLNSYTKQEFLVTVESDVDKTIDPTLILSEFTGKDTVDMSDITFTYLEEQTSYEYYTKWCTDYTYSDCQETKITNGTTTYDVDGGQAEKEIVSINEVEFPKSESQLAITSQHDISVDVNDIVLTANEPKQFTIEYVPDIPLEDGDYGVFSLVVDGVEYYDTTYSSDFNVSNVALYYSFDDDDLSGSNPLDLTPNGNDGTNNGATTGQTGIINEGFLIDSNSEWIEINNFFSGKNTLTFSIWINPYSLDSGSLGSDRTYLVATINDDDGKKPFTVWLDETDDIVLYFNSNVVKTIANTGITINNWHHIVVTLDGSNVRTYLNGNLIDTTAFASTLQSTTENSYIGDRGFPESGGNPNSKFDEVAIFDEALTQEQVDYLYASGSPTEAQQYPFPEPKPLSFVDLELNNVSNNISITANETLTATYYDLNNTGTVDMFRNGVNVSSQNNTPMYLSSGTYTYVVNNTETTNFSQADPVSYTATITESTDEPLTLFINGNSSSFMAATNPINYTVEGSPVTNLSYSVTRDGSNVDGQEGSAITLSENTYDYVLSVNGSGYYEDYTQTITVTVQDVVESTGGTNFNWTAQSTLEYGVCPSTPHALANQWFFVVLLVIIGLYAGVKQNEGLGYIAGIGLVFMSLVTWSCSPIIGAVTIILGLGFLLIGRGNSS